MNGSSVFHTSPDAMSRLVGSETVILDLAGGAYFGLDEVGGRIWDLMRQGRSLSQICDAIVAEFEVTPGIVERDVLALAEDLNARGLIRVT